MGFLGQQLRLSTSLLNSSRRICRAGPSTLRHYSSKGRSEILEEVDDADFDHLAFNDPILESLTPEQHEYLAQYPQYPDLRRPVRAIDSREILVFPPSKDSPFLNMVIDRDADPYASDEDIRRQMERDAKGGGRQERLKMDDDKTDPTAAEIMLESRMALAKHRYYLVNRRITQQTGKGKIHRLACMVVVGNGDGLIGIGAAKGEETEFMRKQALIEAVRNMDTVDRFEERTIWTEASNKFGATKIIMRPRPVGFGLRCHPTMHQILKAAGIKDISAKVWGSRNKVKVLQATVRMLQGGNAPLMMGDGVGGRSRSLEKGSGIRGAMDVELERGRTLHSLRTW